MDKKPLALYIHWPFCVSKCPYCDFNSHVMEAIPYDRFFAAYKRELHHFQSYLKSHRVVSIFFGGGTPSLMPPSRLGSLLDFISGHIDIAPDVEITLEANPTTIEAHSFAEFKAAGINRVSIGVQSLRDEGLRFLGRKHNKAEALFAIRSALKIFDRVSFDLITTKPDQPIDDWKQELKEALAFGTKHLSLYQLTIEKGTPFYSDERVKKFIMPNEEESVRHYELTQSIMETSGLPAYEISNHAAAGQECQHNMIYWRYGEYLGIGPGAHSRIAMTDKPRTAIMMTHGPEAWLSQVEEEGVGIQSITDLTQREMLEEATLMGLRLAEGLDLNAISQLMRCPSHSLYSSPQFPLLVSHGLLNLEQNRLILTPKGRLLLNQVVQHLLD